MISINELEYFGSLAAARAAGYADGDRKTEKGYITRVERPDEEISVFIAKGCRKGQLFYYLPRFDTTQYCYRQYLVKP